MMSDYASKIGTPVARGLHFILILVMIVLAVIGLFMIVFAVIMIFPNAGREGLLARIEAGGAAMPSPQAFARAFFFGAIMTASYMYVIGILRAIVKTLLAGDPFVPENISRLRVMWIVLAMLEIFRMLIHNVVSVPAMSAATQLDETVNITQGDFIDIRIGTWFLVFVIAALAEVFRHGAELRRDQQLTV